MKRWIGRLSRLLERVWITLSILFLLFLLLWLIAGAVVLWGLSMS